MKRIIFITLALVSLNFSNAQWGKKTIKGNGNITSITRNTSDYNTIQCMGWMNFILEKGEEGFLKIEGEENLIEQIITETKNNALLIKTKLGVNLKTSKNHPITITIPFIDINEVSLSGSGEIIGKNKIETPNFEAKLSGSGDMILELEASTIKCNVMGSGDLTLKGKTNTLNVNVKGSGDFHGFNLQANDTEATIIGSGDIKLVCNNNLKARVIGSGDIQYLGKPNHNDSKVTGSGDIKTYTSKKHF